MAIDPICNMEVDESTSEFKSDYNGTSYYFCSQECKDEFDENPDSFI